MSAPTSERDPVIADVLGTIAVPEHRPTFWADLHRRLDAEISIVPDAPEGATVTSIAPGKLPAHAPGGRRPDTGELPSVRALTQERTRRRGRAPWLAIAAGLVVLIGAVGVVTIAGERAGDDADVADAPTDDGRAPADEAGGAATETTLAPASSTTDATTVAALAASPEAAVETWLGDLAGGDTSAAAAELGPRTLGYLQTIGADPVGLMTEAQEGFGAWPSAGDLQIATVPLGPVPQLGTELAVVTIAGTYPGEGGGGYRLDAVPVVLDGDTWKIENVAHLPDRDNRLIFTVPSLNDDGTLAPMGPSDEINVFVPASGVVYFVLDGGPPQSKPTSLVGRNDEPFALYNPGDDLAPGPHQLVVVAVGDDGTITSYGGTFAVEG